MLLDKQEVLNKVWNHFIRDNSPFGIEDGICRYHTESGCPCAIGLLDAADALKGVQTSIYMAFDMERGVLRMTSDGRTLLRFLGSKGVVDDASMSFMMGLQHCHDSAAEDGLRMAKDAGVVDGERESPSIEAISNRASQKLVERLTALASQWRLESPQAL